MATYKESTRQRAAEVTKRVYNAFEKLRSAGLVRNKTEFSERLDTHPNIITGLSNGKRYATLEMICILIDEFPVSAEYLLFGKGEVLVQKQSFLETRVKGLEDRVTELEGIVNAIQGKRYRTTPQPT